MKWYKAANLKFLLVFKLSLTAQWVCTIITGIIATNQKKPNNFKSEKILSSAALNSPESSSWPNAKILSSVNNYVKYKRTVNQSSPSLIGISRQQVGLTYTSYWLLTCGSMFESEFLENET